MRDKLLPFSQPSIGEEEISEVVAALRSGWITSGPRTQQFEQEFARYVGAGAALALNSGTAGLHVALAAIGAGPGSAVITTPMTFCSGVHVIEQMGARPILVDVEPDTLNIDPAAVESAACSLRPGERLAAIMPVHLYGHPCDRKALLDIARRHQCALIEDAAHAFPARYDGTMIGACDDVADVPVLTAFSFYATKNLTTGEGGMLTGPASLIERARLWSLHGISRDIWGREQNSGDGWFYEVTEPGFKYNMSDIQAAIGLAQLAKTACFAARRVEIAARYNEALGELDELQLPSDRSNIEHSRHIYALRLKLERLNISRGRFIAELRQQNIAASVHFIPVHMHRYYADRYGYKPNDFPIACHAYERLVSLPIYPAMTDSDVEDVIDAIRAIVNNARISSRDHAAVEA
jgi:dTDP-4-amino-4,6-dideoxygalactose transaminase